MSDTTDQSTGAEDPKSTFVDRVSDAPEWVRESLSKANAEAAKYRTERNALRDEHTAALNQIGELTDAKQAAEDRAKAAELELLKYKVAVQANVPGALIARLQGSTEEEIRADAEALMKSIPSSPVKRTATDPSQGRGEPDAGLSPGGAFLAKALRGVR